VSKTKRWEERERDGKRERGGEIGTRKNGWDTAGEFLLKGKGLSSVGFLIKIGCFVK
jgi:hypothetical protein